MNFADLNEQAAISRYTLEEISDDTGNNEANDTAIGIESNNLLDSLQWNESVTNDSDEMDLNQEAS